MEETVLVECGEYEAMNDYLSRFCDFLMRVVGLKGQGGPSWLRDAAMTYANTGTPLLSLNVNAASICS